MADLFNYLLSLGSVHKSRPIRRWTRPGRTSGPTSTALGVRCPTCSRAATPFKAKSQYELLQAHHSKEATPLDQVQNDVRAELAVLPDFDAPQEGHLHQQGQRDDNPDTQCAILGLWAARRHGIPLERADILKARCFRATLGANDSWAYTASSKQVAGYSSMTCVGSGILSGFDRLIFKGKLRQLYVPGGMDGYCTADHILRKEFKEHAQEVTAQVMQTSLIEHAKEGERFRYSISSQTSKEEALVFVEQRQFMAGLVCVLQCVQPCGTCDLRSQHGPLTVQGEPGKCSHL